MPVMYVIANTQQVCHTYTSNVPVPEPKFVIIRSLAYMLDKTQISNDNYSSRKSSDLYYMCYYHQDFIILYYSREREREYQVAHNDSSWITELLIEGLHTRRLA